MGRSSRWVHIEGLIDDLIALHLPLAADLREYAQAAVDQVGLHGATADDLSESGPVIALV